MAAYPVQAHWLGRLAVLATWHPTTQAFVNSSMGLPGWHWDDHACLVPCHGAYAAYLAAGGHLLGPNAGVAANLVAHTAAAVSACYNVPWPAGTCLGRKLYDQWACRLMTKLPGGGTEPIFDPAPKVGQVLLPGHGVALNPGGTMCVFQFFSVHSTTTPGLYFNPWLARFEAQMAGELV